MALTHAQRKEIKKLHLKKYRRDAQLFFVEGIKGVLEALISPVDIVRIVIGEQHKDELDIADIIQKAEEQGIDIVFCDERDAHAIKTTETFPGALAVVRMPAAHREDLMNRFPIICLDRVTDPGNLGTIIRTADWFGVPNILLSEDSVDAFNPKTVRATMGSFFHSTIFESGDIVGLLKSFQEDGYRIIVLSTEGTLVQDGEFDDPKSIYIFGSESHGVRKDLVDLANEMYSIPGSGRAESLNVAVAAGIVLSRIK